MQTWTDHARRVERALERLDACARPGFERVAQDDLDAWMDHDLASVAENRLGERLDPRTLDAALRERLARDATDDARLHAPDLDYAQPYWLSWSGERVGTVSLARMPLGSTRCGVSSVYVRPDRRRAGIAGAALDAIGHALRAEGLTGLRLETSWCWRDALAFYLRRGLWVAGWKRELTLVACSSLGEYDVEVQGDEARFAWNEHGRRVVVLDAERSEDRLTWRARTDADTSERAALAPGTFAAHLALAGWPLVTGDAAWADQLRLGFSEFGGPEGLAFRIREWEAASATRGWRSTAPRIPGLRYPPLAAAVGRGL